MIAGFDPVVHIVSRFPFLEIVTSILIFKLEFRSVKDFIGLIDCFLILERDNIVVCPAVDICSNVS